MRTAKTDQIGQMPRLIWVFVGRTLTLFVLSCCGSYFLFFFCRTPVLRWSYVVTNFVQVLGCILYTYYIFERFCVPVFRNFNREHVTPKPFIIAVFSCMLPGTLVLLIGEYPENLQTLNTVIILKHDKTNKMTCVPSADSDQPGHLPSLRCVRSVGS